MFIISGKLVLAGLPGVLFLGSGVKNPPPENAIHYYHMCLPTRNTHHLIDYSYVPYYNTIKYRADNRWYYLLQIWLKFLL